MSLNAPPDTGWGTKTIKFYSNGHKNNFDSPFREKQPGKFVGDTECTKLPIELCGTNECKAEEGEEECHNKG